MTIYVKGDNVPYFYSFGVQYIPNENQKFISNKILKQDICLIQAFDSIMSKYFCIEFIFLYVK